MFSYTERRLILAIVSLLGFAAVAAPDPGPLDQGYRAMYNLDFSAAHAQFQDWERTHPDDPLGPVSDAAAYLFFEFDRLKVLHSEFFVEDHTFFKGKRLRPDPTVKANFESALDKSKRLADAMLKRDPNSEGALLAKVMATALHADYLALIDKEYWQALNEVKDARNRADALVAKYPDCKDAYLAVGVENYLLSQKAAAVRLFLRITGAQTDKQTGIAKLRIVAEGGHYLKPYAKILLAIAALRDDRRVEARQLMTELAQQFPRNDLFKDEVKKLSCTANC
jgi:hypothetical protein